MACLTYRDAAGAYPSATCLTGYSRPTALPVLPFGDPVDNAPVKAIARAFRWQKMLETGRCATIKEIARAEKINPSCVSRVLRLKLFGTGDGGGDPWRACERRADARRHDGPVPGRVDEASGQPLPPSIDVSGCAAVNAQ
jgi:hypothetical protein